MISIESIRIALLGVVFLLLLVFILKPNHSKKLNWALFYAFIWMFFALPITNYLCVHFGLWSFTEANKLKIPYDLLFMWLFFWMIPFYIFRGKFLVIVLLTLFWLDVLIMPILEEKGLLYLSKNWLIGEFSVILFVFLPSYLWAKFSFETIRLTYRAVFQSVTMIMFLFIVLPFLVVTYQGAVFSLKNTSSIYIQIVFIIALPSLIAVIDLVEKGRGTPFPYDKTERLVTSGVYAYIRNPIQWSFTVLFIPLSIYHNSLLLFLGFMVSIAYTIGLSNPQEFQDMKERFHEKWIAYKKVVPSWCFLWKPIQYPKATIYFKRDCSQCEGIKEWFEKKNPLNLDIMYADFYKGKALQQATYKNEFNQEFKSVKAIAYALEHINLGYATLGWFMRFPVINYILQIIIDGLGFSEENRMC